MVTYSSIIEWYRGRRQTLLSVGWVTGSQALAAFFAIVGGLVQARYVSPEILGNFSAFTILAGYLTFLHLGALIALQREYPYWLGKGDIERAREAAAVTQSWMLIVGIGILGLYVSLAAISLYQNNWMAAAGWASQTVVSFSFYALYLGNTYRSTNEFVTWSKITCVGASLGLLTVPLVVWLGFWGLCLRAVIPAVASIVILHVYRPVRVKPLFRFDLLKKQFSFGLPISIPGFFATSCMMSCLMTVIFWQYGAAVLGLFALARMGESVMHQMGVSITQVFLPRINILMAQTESLRACTKYIIKPLLACSLSMILIIVGGIVCAWLLIPFVAPEYEESLPIFAILAWSGLVPVLLLPHHVFIAAKQQRPVMAALSSMFLAFVVCAALVYALGLGPEWQATAYMIGKAFGLAVCYWCLWRQVIGEANIRMAAVMSGYKTKSHIWL